MVSRRSKKRFTIELAQARTLKEAAERVGISISTAKRYKADPLVQQYVAELPPSFWTRWPCDCASLALERPMSWSRRWSKGIPGR